MELIKKVKEAETQARDIIAKAKTEATARGEAMQQKRLEALEKAEQERKQATEAAITKAESEGHAEVGGLKAEAETHRRELRQNVESKMAAATAKVMEHLKG